MLTLKNHTLNKQVSILSKTNTFLCNKNAPKTYIYINMYIHVSTLNNLNTLL